MGSGSSTASKHKNLGKNQKDIVKLMMPLYFDPVEITVEEHKLAEYWWQLILTDKTPEFLTKKGTEGFSYQSCVTFFYDNFYVRLFDIHPAAKDLFKTGMKGQGKFLVMMLSLALSELEKPAQFDKSLLKLAEIHYKRGVKAVEYGIVGDVLFWTLRKVIGDASYTEEVHRVWVKVYSRMLKTIVPSAVAHELQSDTTVRRDMTGMFSDGSSTPNITPSNDDNSNHELESQRLITSHKLSNSVNVSIRAAEEV